VTKDGEHNQEMSDVALFKKAADQPEALRPLRLVDTCRVGSRRMFAEARQMHRSSVVSPRRRL